MRPPGETRRNLIAVALAFTALFGAIVVVALVVRDDLFRDCDFDAEAWASDSEGLVQRYESMGPVADDLVKCDDLIYGDSAGDVRDLLGDPDHTFGEGEKQGPPTWVYDIGVPEHLSDYPGLNVAFDADQTVERVSIPGYVTQ